MKPLLSILISSIPSRFDKAIVLYNSLLVMCEGLDVEILLLCDNKKRSIGAKREALKNISNGVYTIFVDDDDQLLSVIEIYEAILKQEIKWNSLADVITFKAECFNNDGSKYIVTFGLGNDVEHNIDQKEDGTCVYIDSKRPPFHVCAWHEYYKQFSFPDINYSEDWEFIKKCLPHAKNEIHIDKVLFRYNFDINASEASTESNEHWVNPNNILCGE